MIGFNNGKSKFSMEKSSTCQGFPLPREIFGQGLPREARSRRDSQSFFFFSMDVTERPFTTCLVGGLEHGFYFSIQLGISSSQLTFTPSFFRGVGQPPTSCPPFLIHFHFQRPSQRQISKMCSPIPSSHSQISGAQLDQLYIPFFIGRKKQKFLLVICSGGALYTSF